MRVYQREAERLRKTESTIDLLFPRFGVNKKREIKRLLYEIAKREDIPPGEIIAGVETDKFLRLKNYLLKRRYPTAFPQCDQADFYLPELRLATDHAFTRSVNPFRPARIYLEEAARGTFLARRFRDSFPEAAVIPIRTINEFLQGRQKFGISDYNRRGQSVFITASRADFFKRCPCTRGAVPCGYHIFNLAFGCLYECTYCYLQEYVNTPGLVFPANLEDFFAGFEAYREKPSTRRWQKGPRLRIGTGEFSDSLMIDEVTEYSLPIIEFFRGRPEVVFEFKTKSANIRNLLRARPGGNIVVAWSLSPQRLIDENEFYTASLEERLKSARLCAEAGYRLAFHFDPVIYYPGWEEDYRGVVDLLGETVEFEKIEWISLGTLRFKPDLKPVIEQRFPGNKILDGEMILGFDRKLRYPEKTRLEVYRKLIGFLRKYGRRLPLYLCMEEKKIWDALKLPFPFK
jgi:spore photoproduct lyase